MIVLFPYTVNSEGHVDLYGILDALHIPGRKITFVQRS